MTNELAGRVAIVTGAGRNIGRAIALALADAGAGVAVNGRTNRADVDAVVAEIESRGGKALAVMADVSDEAAVQRMAAAAVERFGHIDILVNNAAIRPEKPFESLSLSDWRAVHSVILEGAFLTVKAALPHLKASGSGARPRRVRHHGELRGPGPDRHGPRRGHQAPAAPPAEQHARRPFRHAPGDRRRGPLPRRAGRALHHRSVAPRERRRLP